MFVVAPASFPRVTLPVLLLAAAASPAQEPASVDPQSVGLTIPAHAIQTVSTPRHDSREVDGGNR